jgi:hypothetical protein
VPYGINLIGVEVIILKGYNFVEKPVQKTWCWYIDSFGEMVLLTLTHDAMHCRDFRPAFAWERYVA